jgi:two-component system response regulator YesN
MNSLLIVDDEPEVVEGLVNILDKLDELQLFTAYQALEAIEIMKTHQISIILADIHMPGMNGLELCECIQKKWPETRIIFLSSVRDFDVIYRSIRNPAVRYLTKMEPDYKIQETILQVLHDMNEQRQQKQLKEIVLRTFPQSLLNGIVADDKYTDVVENICDYIRNNLDRDLSLNSLGTKVGYNPNYLSRIFKEKIGLGLSEYIMRLRMCTARELVLSSNKKIQDIATAVGYDSLHSFIRAYRKTYGMSPNEYRRVNVSKQKNPS